MTILKDRVKVASIGTDTNTNFTLGVPEDSFTTFPSGEVGYTVLAETDEWQVGTGTVTGNTLGRGTVESNHLGTTDQIDFTGKPVLIALTINSKTINDITLDQHTHDNKVILDSTSAVYTTTIDTKITGIEEEATTDQLASEVPYTTPVDMNATDVQAGIDEVNSKANIVQINLDDHIHQADEIVYDISEDPYTLQTNVQGAMEDHVIAIENHTQEASSIVYDAVDDNLTDGTNLQVVVTEHANDIVKRVPPVSGVISGLALTQLTATTFQVAAGEGVITDAYTDPLNITRADVTVPSDTNTTLVTNGLSAALTKIFVNNLGDVVQETEGITNNLFRTSIYLGVISSINGSITDVLDTPVVINQTSTDLLDTSFDTASIEGSNVIASNLTALSFYINIGSLFLLGSNWTTNRANPNNKILPAIGDESTPTNFQMMHQSGGSNNGEVVVTPVSVLPKAVNATGETLTPLVDTQCVIHRVYNLGFNDGDRKILVLYGQNVYTTAAEAEAALADDTVNTIFPTIIDSLVLLAYIGVGNDAVDFTDGTKAWILAPSAGTGTVSSGGSGSAIWGTITGDMASQTDLQTALDTKEPLIGTKNTAFNKDFGVFATTVCEGDDVRLTDSRIPTAHIHPSTEITYDSSIDPVTSETDLQLAMLDQSNSIEQRVSSSSGLKTGGLIVAGSDPNTTFTVQDGTGEILDSFTDPQNTSVIELSWNSVDDGVSIVNQSINTGGLEASLTRIYMSPTKTILQVPNTLNLANARNNILIGGIVTINGIIVDIINAPSIVKQTSTDVLDLLSYNTDLSGSHIFPVTNELQIWIEEGILFYPGINWYSSKENPNVKILIQQGNSTTPITMYEVTQDGVVSNTASDVIPLEYNPSGSSRIALGNPDSATIHRLYSTGVDNRNFLLLLGQNEYGDAVEAKNNLWVDATNSVFPDATNNLTFLGYICVSTGTTDFNNLADSWIVSGVTGSTTSSGSTIVSHTALDNRDAVDSHPQSAITNLTTDLGNKISALEDDLTPTLAATLDTDGNIIALGDGVGSYEGAMLNMSTEVGSAFVFSTDGTYNPDNGAFVVKSGTAEIHGAVVKLSGLTPASDSQVYIDTTGGLYTVSPPAPAWEEVDSDVGVYNMPTLGAWVEMVNLTITLPEDVANGDRLNILLYTSITNDHDNDGGSIVIGFGIDAAEPINNSEPKGITQNFSGVISTLISLINHGGLTAGQTITAYVRRETQEKAGFNPVADGSVTSHSLTVGIPSDGGTGTSDHSALINRNLADQHTTASITGLDSELAGKVSSASPALTGVPTSPTANPGTDTVQIATTAFVIANQTSPTSLSQGTTSTSVYNITSDGSVDDLAIPAATSSQAGVLSSSDKDRLDSITGTNTGDQTITLTGDATGTGSGSFVVTVVDDSHNHITSNVDGLDTALVEKQPIVQSSFNQVADADVATTHVFDYAQGDMQQVTATADVAIDVTGFVPNKVCAMIIDVVNFGNYTISFTSPWLFAAKTVPTFTADSTDRLLLTQDKDNIVTLTVIAQDIGILA